jgi:hypothetical protein
MTRDETLQNQLVMLSETFDHAVYSNEKFVESGT